MHYMYVVFKFTKLVNGKAKSLISGIILSLRLIIPDNFFYFYKREMFITHLTNINWSSSSGRQGFRRQCSTDKHR